MRVSPSPRAWNAIPRTSAAPAIISIAAAPSRSATAPKPDAIIIPRPIITAVKATMAIIPIARVVKFTLVNSTNAFDRTNIPAATTNRANAPNRAGPLPIAARPLPRAVRVFSITVAIAEPILVMMSAIAVAIF